MNIEAITAKSEQIFQNIVKWVTSPEFYAQCLIVVCAVVIAFIISKILKKYLVETSKPLGSSLAAILHNYFYRLSEILFPLFSVLLIGLAIELSSKIVGQSGLVRVAHGLALILLIYKITSKYVQSAVLIKLIHLVAFPIAVMYALLWLDDVTSYLNAISFQVGNIKLSLYAIVRLLIFGSILFWLGHISNVKGKQFIRNQDKIESRAREAYAKLFEIVLFITIFILLLNVIGINLTTLAVFGGAIGIGIGFGLQAIASNFISGLIILLDRSLTVGDHIELEDGRVGTIRALNMRSTILETFDGKDIMVPNETFITTSFKNWTRKDIKQRYSIEVQVAYSTDIEKLIKILRDVVASHPQVISGPEASIEERPDAEISGFGDSGIDILIEYWMEGVDDGRNRVGADLNMMIWQAFKENNIEIPFPQREVKILNRS